MNNSRLFYLIGTFILTFGCASVNATLVDQGNGTVLDTDLGIYWLSDANLPKQIPDGNDFGIGYIYIHPNGGMSWYTAMVQSPTGDRSYIDRMNDENYLGFNGWRLPTIDELEHLFYDEFDGTPGSVPDNTGPFTTVETSGFYWSNTDDPGNSSNVLGFSFSGGLTFPRNKQFNDHYVWPVRDGPVGVSGTVKTTNGQGICAMVLASGRYMFSCNPVGVISLTDLQREPDGTVKRQIYADGFFPKIDVLTGSTNDAVVMTRSGTCPNYNTPYDPGVFPDSAGKRIDISGKVLLQDSQTPICAMVLANGQYMFSCDGTGNYALNIPLDSNGQFKLQVYADGFAPITKKFDEFQPVNIIRMARAVECQ